MKVKDLLSKEETKYEKMRKKLEDEVVSNVFYADKCETLKTNLDKLVSNFNRYQKTLIAFQ